jgi:hypothetical protein
VTINDLVLLGASVLFASFSAGAWFGARQEHANWLNSARVGTSQFGRDGVFYRVEAEKGSDPDAR